MCILAKGTRKNQFPCEHFPSVDIPRNGDRQGAAQNLVALSSMLNMVCLSSLFLGLLFALLTLTQIYPQDPAYSESIVLQQEIFENYASFAADITNISASQAGNTPLHTIMSNV